MFFVLIIRYSSLLIWRSDHIFYIDAKLFDSVFLVFIFALVYILISLYLAFFPHNHLVLPSLKYFVYIKNIIVFDCEWRAYNGSDNTVIKSYLLMTYVLTYVSND